MESCCLLNIIRSEITNALHQRDKRNDSKILLNFVIPLSMYGQTLLKYRKKSR